jgi:hypothetical protein
MIQGYKRRESGEQPFSRPTPVDGSIKLVLSCNSPLVYSRSITIIRSKGSYKMRSHQVYNIIPKSREWLLVNCVVNAV